MTKTVISYCQAPQIWRPARRQLKKTAVPSRCLPVRSLDNKDPARNQASAERALRALARASRLQSVDPLDGLMDDSENASLSCQNVEVEARSQSTRGNAAEALLRLAAHPREFEDMDSAAIDTLLQFNQRQTASINKAVQVNPGTVPSTCRTLIDLFHSDACVKAFTGVEDLRLFMVIANAVAEVDDMKAERSVLERVTVVLVRLKTSLSFRCSATLFSVSER